MDLIDRIKRRRRINRTIRELSGLGDQMLLDIGIERLNISEMAEKMVDAENNPKRSIEQYEQVQQPSYRVSNGAPA